jgi:hypothetical protein
MPVNRSLVIIRRRKSIGKAVSLPEVSTLTFSRLNLGTVIG